MKHVSAIVVALLVSNVAAAAPAAGPLLAEVQASYAKVQHLRASFTQTVSNATFGTRAPTRGTLYLVRPDKMRWDYVNAKARPDKSVIFDGTTLWIVEPKNLQVFEHATQDPTLPAALAFLEGGSLANDFTITSPAADTLELVPKAANAQIKKLTFVIDPQTRQVIKSIVVNFKDDTNTFVFSNVDVDTAPSERLFQFSPKRVPTYKVIHVP